VTRWVALSAVLAIHEEQLAEHGGLDGIRDFGLLESALHRPRDLQSYGQPDLADLAAAYAFGIARNHPFLDGNKRTSAVVTRLFLRLNGHDLDATQAERLAIWLALGAGDTTEQALADWMRSRLVKS
jgi:death on curing protein